MSIGFKSLCFGRIARNIELTPLAGHAMGTLRPIRIRTVAMPEMNVFVSLAFGSSPTLDRCAIQKDLNNGDITFEIARIQISLR
jgi:hypothetical protein